MASSPVAPPLSALPTEQDVDLKLRQHAAAALQRPTLAYMPSFLHSGLDRSFSDSTINTISTDTSNTSPASPGTPLSEESGDEGSSPSSSSPSSPRARQKAKLISSLDLVAILRSGKPAQRDLDNSGRSSPEAAVDDESAAARAQFMAKQARIPVPAYAAEEQAHAAKHAAVPEQPQQSPSSAAAAAVSAAEGQADSELITPVAALAMPVGQVSAEPTDPSDPSSSSTDDEKSALEADKPTRWQRFGTATQAFFRRHYFIYGEPALVLPTPPSDKEKLDYVETYRPVLVAVGIFAFLANSTGIWFFATAAPPFFWYAALAAFLQLYLGLFYLLGCFSRNFDHTNHVRVVQEHAITPLNAPTVDVYLPCCNEPLEILENTYKYASKLDYPEGKLQIHVLDDGTMPEVAQLAASYGLHHIVRDDRGRLKKAGNLRWAFTRTSGDFFVIFDADFCPRADYLTELIPRMIEDTNIAIIQTPQYFRSLDSQTWVERGAGAVQELFYRFIQTNRDKWGGAICVGSNAVYRREALREVGGTAEVGASEDVHTGFYAKTRGWCLAYMPINLACGICPDTPRAYFSQQVRWCQGSTSLLLNRHFWTSSLSKMQKLCYLSGMMFYSATALGIVSSPLPGILLVVFRVDLLKVYNLVFALPVIIYGIVVFRLWSRTAHSLCVQKIGIIQQYAYFSSLKDRVLGTSFDWVPSGGNSTKHRSTRYRNMRMMCIVWTTTYQSTFFGVVIWRLIQGYTWWVFIPLMILSAYNLFIALPFMLSP